MSVYQVQKFRITGVSPLLMHNGQLADPLNPFSVSIAEITGKRKKVEADHRELARREFMGSLYMMAGGPCIPSEAIEAAMIGGAKKAKKGTQAKIGILVENNAVLIYKGPRAPDLLWKDGKFEFRAAAKVGTGKVMRTRPIFREWAAEIEISFIPEHIGLSDVRASLVAAGDQVGLLDWRPRHGRFTVK